MSPAPLKLADPPPGFFAEAKLSAATASQPSSTTRRWHAASVVSAVTSMRAGTACGCVVRPFSSTSGQSSGRTSHVFVTLSRSVDSISTCAPLASV